MFKHSLILLLFLLPGLACAEGGCPPGQVPYSGTYAMGSAESLATCGPIPTSRPAPPVWQSRWGAVASDSTGEFGIVTDMKSERAAKKAALAECAKRGGVSCSANFTFHNQCAAVVSSESISFSQGAPTEEKAKELAMSQCTAAQSGRCWLYYSGCSLPVQTK